LYVFVFVDVLLHRQSRRRREFWSGDVYCTEHQLLYNIGFITVVILVDIWSDYTMTYLLYYTVDFNSILLKRTGFRDM
jgi:hypothetical protein